MAKEEKQINYHENKVQRTFVDALALTGFMDEAHFSNFASEYLSSVDMAEKEKILRLVEGSRGFVDNLPLVELKDVVSRDLSTKHTEAIQVDPIFRSAFQSRPFKFAWVRPERIIGLPEFAARDLQKYIEVYRVDSCSSLFTTSRGPMTYDFIRKVIKEEGTRAGDPKMHPHALRHFYGTHAIRLRLDVREVQMALGHRDIRSTQRYTHPLMEEVAKRSSSVFENYFQKGEKTKGYAERSVNDGKYGNCTDAGCGI